ncbi:MAG: aminopeptidase P family protein [Acidipropionibacterium sp.]|jgi:Xaa-Pro aminopeptidase|nr:aminopeptidase P family protein [Acidipropionibacterium sp.]
MSAGWDHEPAAPSLAPGTAQTAGRHRDLLSAALPGQVIVVASGTAPVRNDDCNYAFRPNSDFVWLTGCQAEGAVLTMIPSAEGYHARLHITAPFRPGDSGFFSSATHGELWVGPASGPEQWAEALDIEVDDVDLLSVQESTLRGGLAAGSVTDQYVTGLGLQRSAELDRVLSELRSVKDAWEIAQLRQAIDATVGGFAAVASEIPRAISEGLGERWLQGTFDRHARTFGNGPGYASIVGSGPHAPTLHWVRCDGPILPSETLLLDMGVEANSLYTADVTRTLPPSGSFTPAQRAVHDLVEKAHRAGLEQVRPGTEYLDFHFAAMEVIAQGLHDWGLLPVSVDEALSPGGQQHRRWLVCGIGHYLGLDVHDCSHSSYEAYQGTPLQPGMVMTVEPGLYFHSFDAKVPPELRGIGVRIEDDVLVTPGGSEVLSRDLPIDAAGLEIWTSQHLV